MYSEKQLLLRAIELLKAIQDDDINLTQNLVQDLNGDFENRKEKNLYFNNILVNHNKFNNESYKYMIYNLQYLTNAETIQWEFEINSLLKENNKNQLKNFIATISQSEDPIPHYKKNALVQICITLDKYDLLEQLMERLEEG